MFKLNERIEINRNNSKCDYIRYSPSEISTINTPNSQPNNNKPTEDSVNTVAKSFLDINFDVLNAATNNIYAGNDGIRLVSLGPIALFSFYKLTTSPGKHLENIEHGHIACLLYILLTAARECDELSIGFDLNHDKRKRELTNDKNIKRKFHVRILLKDFFFGFAEHQEKATYGLGYKRTLTRNTYNAVLNEDNIVNNAKINTNSIDRYVPRYTQSISQPATLFKQTQSNTHTELKYEERSIFLKAVNIKITWNFELGTQEGITFPIWIFVIFQQNDRGIDQNLNNATFNRMPNISSMYYRN